MIEDPQKTKRGHPPIECAAAAAELPKGGNQQEQQKLVKDPMVGGEQAKEHKDCNDCVRPFAKGRFAQGCIGERKK